MDTELRRGKTERHTHGLGPRIYRMKVLKDARNPRWTGVELDLSAGQGCKHREIPEQDTGGTGTELQPLGRGREAGKGVGRPQS